MWDTLYIATLDLAIVISHLEFGRNSSGKGQIKSEWIYDVINFINSFWLYLTFSGQAVKYQNFAAL